ncbi:MULTISPECIES: FHA domain-containing protein [unclassified Leifsonia]|uniref:FHA domain-containing protein FhaB/FipA n=1 Tax=unclassified Leifsonia TaxID=2663824 RepID=UPI0008A7B928|nr:MULTISPECIES: FHA domain-containing protein [unclassified Leifsonia]SEH62262.1 FHA domain-containing protein [Leifsonia sp. CL154]SFL17140.1 FHA domain-containing protein [Leifsonia sp. CL147]
MNPSELTLLVLRFGFLLLLWLFVFGIVYALRTDLFGQRVRKLPESQASGASPFPAGPGASPAASAHPVPAGPTEPVMKAAPVSSLPSGANRAGGHANASVQSAHRLVITSGPRSGTELALGRDPITIGRSGESNLVIRDDYTSTHHARLLLWNDEWMIQDLDSTNGTFLDGRRVTVPTQIPLDTPIKIGTTTFELRR